MKKNIGALGSVILIIGIVVALYFIFYVEQEKVYRTTVYENDVAVFNVDGKVYSRTAIVDGKLEYTPDNPEKENYVFDYWEINGKKFDENTKLNKDVTLNAVLKKESLSSSSVVSVKEVKIDKSNISVLIGKSEKITGSISPSNATNRHITWISENSNIATVDSSGNIKGEGIGTTTVIARSNNGKEAKCKVTVTGNEVTVQGIRIDKAKTSINEGDKITLELAVIPSNASNKTITWSSSDKEIATVSQNGIVEGKKAGNAIIKARSYNGKETECKITVVDKKIEVTSVSLDVNNKNIEVGKSFELKATVSPSDATNKNITWTSSDESIAKVKNGIVEGIREGTVVIKAFSSNGKGSECKVVVKKGAVKTIAVTSLSISNTNLSMVEKDKATLKVTVNPSNANDKTVTWSSSSSKIVMVDDNGAITAVGVGEATITAKASSGVYTQCKVKVSPKTVAVSAVILNKLSLSINVGESTTLQGTVSPLDATDQSITWTSSNTSVATVNNGLIKGIKAGTATITAKSSNGKTATATVSVLKNGTIIAKSITLNASSGSLLSTKTKTLSATILPENTTDKTIIWTSSDNSIATVSSKGVVRAKKAGTAKITASTSNGLKASFDVKVNSISIVMIGNSKTYRANKPSTYNVFKKMMDNGGFSSNITYVTKGGSSLKEKATTEPYKTNINKKYDIAILQEKTEYAATGTDYKTGISKIKKLLVNNNKNIDIYLREGWQTLDTIKLTGDNNQLKANNNAATYAKTYDMKIIKDGSTFLEYIKKYGSANTLFNISDNNDHNHASNEGTYLAAACIYKAITNKNPEKLTYYGENVSSKVAKKLQTIANNVC